MVQKVSKLMLLSDVLGRCGQIWHGEKQTGWMKKKSIKRRGERGEPIDKEFCLAGKGTLLIF